MIISIVESDVPRSIGKRIAEYVARPPKPILRFYGEHFWEGDTFNFHVRNGLPIPLFYGVYVEADGDYREDMDHIGPFGTDNWKVDFDSRPSRVSIKISLVPVEITVDKLVVS